MIDKVTSSVNIHLSPRKGDSGSLCQLIRLAFGPGVPRWDIDTPKRTLKQLKRGTSVTRFFLDSESFTVFTCKHATGRG